jgi:hypothetical protein
MLKTAHPMLPILSIKSFDDIVKLEIPDVLTDASCMARNRNMFEDFA